LYLKLQDNQVNILELFKKQLILIPHSI
jgi:hypothetical protein